MNPENLTGVKNRKAMDGFMDWTNDYDDKSGSRSRMVRMVTSFGTAAMRPVSPRSGATTKQRTMKTPSPSPRLCTTTRITTPAGEMNLVVPSVTEDPLRFESEQVIS